jgi:hypothetical protein
MERERKSIGRSTSSRDVLFYFVAILFEGRLYEAIVEGGKLRLTRRNHIMLVTKARTTEYFSDFKIDVVAVEGLSQYLQLLEEDVKSLRGYFTYNRSKLEKKADDLMAFFE